MFNKRICYTPYGLGKMKIGHRDRPVEKKLVTALIYNESLQVLSGGLCPLN